jgi:putative colanic acid biosynthesis UDP-glucose lipid carrier transferase
MDEHRVLQSALVAVDTAALAAAIGGAALIRDVLDDLLPVAALAEDRHLIASAVAIPVLLLLFHLHGLYRIDQILAGTREYVLIAHSSTYGVVGALAVSYFAGGGPLVSRSWVLMVWLLTLLCVGGGRFAVRRVVRYLKRHGRLRTRVAIVGASNLGVDIARQFLASKNDGIDVVGFLDEYLPIGEELIEGVSVMGRPTGAAHRTTKLADEYILIPGALPSQRLDEISRAMVSPGGPALRLAVSSSELLTHGIQLVQRGGVPLVTVERACITGVDAMLKRALDLSIAGLAVGLLTVISLPLLLRGMRGRRQWLVRHRIYDGDGQSVTVWLLDPSLTSWPLLRGLPALLAVIAGRLSVVGPRPVEVRGSYAPRSTLGLTAAKPGLTGPWRLSGREASLERQSVLDLEYVRAYSIWDDLRIIVESVRRLIAHDDEDRIVRWHEGNLPELRLAPNGLLARAGDDLVAGTSGGSRTARFGVSRPTL